MVMIISEAPWADDDAYRMLEKLLRSAAIDPYDDILFHMGGRGGREGLIEEIRATAPRVIIALGTAPARLLLRGDSKFSLGPLVGLTLPAPDFDGVLVMPAYHPSYLLRHGIAEVRRMVKILKIARRFDGR